MSSLAAKMGPISIEDYLAGEKDGEVRYEYAAGHVYAMTGASRTHGLLVTMFTLLLGTHARELGCQLFQTT